MVRNPMNPRQVSRIPLTPEVVDCIVFWTKNPAPLMPYLPQLEAMGYRYIFQMTLNAYGREVEMALPPVEARVQTLQRLAERIGKQRIVWRYDPILLSDRYTVHWHGEQFARLADAVADCADHGVISFLDVYGKVRSRLNCIGARACTEEEMHRLAALLAGAARARGLPLQTCAERVDLAPYGIQHGACIDGTYIGRVLGAALDVRRDANQRGDCRCVASIDIGAYDTCRNGCVYCYANHGEAVVTRHAAQHREDSALLAGELTAQDAITERKAVSLLVDSEQLSLL